MAGFANDIVYANNADFSIAGSNKGQLANGLLTNGQFWIGSTALNVGGTHINVGTITSPLGTLNIGYSSPNITIDSNGSGFPWIDQATGITLAANTGYFVTAATTQTLPAAPSQGNVVKIICDTTGAVVVTANAGQTIRLGNTASSGANTFTSTARGDALELIYRAATTQWIALDSVGNWTISS